MTCTFDTGMLIALERRKPYARQIVANLVRRRVVPVVPAVAYTEWWRGPSAARREILRLLRVEPMDEALCRATGEALAAMPRATLADTAVMASAALRGGGVVYTSDREDLWALTTHFPTVIVLDV